MFILWTALKARQLVFTNTSFPLTLAGASLQLVPCLWSLGFVTRLTASKTSILRQILYQSNPTPAGSLPNSRHSPKATDCSLFCTQVTTAGLILKTKILSLLVSIFARAIKNFKGNLSACELRKISISTRCN